MYGWFSESNISGLLANNRSVPGGLDGFAKPVSDNIRLLAPTP